jgi:hypothetical protein
MTYNRNYESLRIDGCGLNAEESVVEDLAWRLFGNVEAVKRRDI